MSRTKRILKVKGKSANSCVIMPASITSSSAKEATRRRRKLAKVKRQEPRNWTGLWSHVAQALPLVLVAVLVAGATLGAYRLYLEVLSSPYLGLKQVVVNGNKRISDEEIEMVASLAPKTNLLQIDVAAVEARIAQHPWIQRVKVEREFPNRIEISVVEHKAAAILVDENSFLVDTDGTVFKVLEPQEYDPDLLVIAGLEVGRLERANNGDRAQELVRKAVAIADLYNARELAQFYPVVQVEFDELDGFSLVSSNDERFVLGFDGFPNKLSRLEQVFMFLDKTDQKLSQARLDNEKEPWRVVVSGTTLKGELKEVRMRHLQMPVETQEWMLP